MGKLGKRFKSAEEVVQGKQDLSIEDAISLVKGTAKAKFDETIDIAINLGVDPRHADQMVRGVCTLPNGTGKKSKIAVWSCSLTSKRIGILFMSLGEFCPS